MVYKASFFLALILISNILLLNVAGRSIGKNSNNQDKKEPQFFFKHEHIGFPPAFGITPRNPFSGGAGAGTGTGRSYVPGGDDTFVPNPGFEVPIPGGGGRVPPVVHP
ncbi:putative cell wall protein [Lupinus albus]|uniref:Putative cell wall protein n=1 Tax=Lupinus albus TaxID=3870 RepID=A0A6A4NLQ1_LUPAL|nr:putative cell wall protein [Lupinus albus]